MTLDYATLDLLRQSHPAWRLLRSEHAPLVASFLQRVFIAPNVRVMAQADLAEALEDELYALRERRGGEAFRSRRSITSTTGRRTTRAGCASITRRGRTNRIST
jgi:hypothetical protein